MIWTSLDTWIIIIGILSASACAVLGNYLVLRQMSMMGDAISHAVLPGLAIAFLLTGSRDSLPMFIGAAAVGVLTVVFTQLVNHFGKVDRSAAMGVVFTSLFALGLIIIVKAADAVDLDPGCVLYGSIELTPLNTKNIFNFNIPSSALSLSIILLINLLFIIIFYKELKICSFDPALATTLGINSTIINYLLMTLVAVTTVASFESVGSILVIAMLIVPGATAFVLTNKLKIMITFSIIIASLSAILGHLSAITIPSLFGFSDTNTAGMMAVISGLFLIIAIIFSPKQGFLIKYINQLRINLKITKEDILGLLYRFEKMELRDTTKLAPKLLYEAKGTGPLLFNLSINKLLKEQKIVKEGFLYKLTENGLNYASNLLRSHRLWESYIQKHLATPDDHLHFAAHQLEHITDNEMQKKLNERTGNPKSDPHGKKIPD